MAVADRRAGAHPSYGHQRRRERHRGAEAGRPAGVDADEAGADPAHRVMGPRVGQGRGGRREVALCRAQATGAGGLEGPGEPAPAEVVARSRRGRRCTRGGPSGRPPRPRPAARHGVRRGTGAARRSGRHRHGPCRRRGAGGPVPCPVRRRRLPGARVPGTATSTWRRAASAKSASTGLSQLRSGASTPASRSGQASAEGGDAERRRTVRQRGPGDVERAVSEPVGLDHRHQRPRGAGGDQAGVVGDRGEVDVEAWTALGARCRLGQQDHAVDGRDVEASNASVAGADPRHPGTRSGAPPEVCPGS